MDQSQVIAGIRLGRIIGAGATGVVHDGTVIATGQPVAVKLVRPQPGQPQRLVERTVQEGRVGWAVRNEHVVRVYEWGMAGGGAAYIVMERLEGETLAERLLALGKLPPDKVVEIARQAARGLAAIHAEGGVHRDIKPENVYLCHEPPDRVKLLDLGIVHLGNDHPARLVRTGVGLVVGTLGYLAPEQARGGVIDARSDLYGLGATLFHALTGSPPHPEGDIVDVLRYIALTTEAPTLPADVPEPLADLIRDLLAPAPDDRPSSASEVSARLERIAPRLEDDDDTARVAAVDDPFPAMDEIADHQQIRAGIIAAVARAIRTGEGPSALSSDLAGLDRLKDRRRAAAARSKELRRQTTALAEELDARRRTLEGTRTELESAQDDVRARYLQSTAALMEIADSIEDIDRRYLRYYEQLDALLSDSEPPAETPGGQRVRSVPHCLAEMEALHQSRAFFADSQASVRARLRTQHRAVSGINLQIIEIKRELLAVEAERQATLVGLEDALRAAEDEVLQLDREIEHQFLRLGFIVQAHQARRRAARAHEAGPSDSVELVTRDGRRAPRVVGRINPDRRSINATPRDRRSANAQPADRRSANARPADRRSANAQPADRRSANARSTDRRSANARPTDRRSANARPTDRRSANARPADRRSANARPADRRSANARPADRRSANAGPTDRRSASVAPADRRSLNHRQGRRPSPPPVPETPTLDETDEHPTDPRRQALADEVETNPRHRADRTDELETLPRTPALGDSDNDTTAPHESMDVPFAIDLESSTRPDQQSPARRTAELVSPEPQPGAPVRERSSHPPPLPSAVMTSAPDRRASQRIACTIRVEVDAADERALLTSRDLSEGGVFVFSPQMRPPGQVVVVTLHLGKSRLRLDGVVAHSQLGVGFGVRFEPAAPAISRRLGQFLEGARG